MDLRLLDRLQTVDWSATQAVFDLACGTGRIGASQVNRNAQVAQQARAAAQVLLREATGSSEPNPAP
jgi:hypothetical protein